MEHSLRQCLRQTSRTRFIRPTTSRLESLGIRRCIATIIRPTTSRTPPSQLSKSSQFSSRSPNLQLLRSNGSISRRYSTQKSESSIAGTIGEGEAGANDSLPSTLQAPEHLDEQERVIFDKLNSALEPIELQVQDISGGCGSMYGIDIVSEKFRGKGMLAQQRMVNSVLGEMIKGWHGVQLKCRVP